ncbi:hypothetical protein SAMN06265173_1703 [Thalassovita litoralis]|uniref:Uncharacterized protein n=1 Tax=Thalassovita litoralis TaxID=1010611 RepID=A0A521FV69_9RHOB|nr:hypothetical protein [Thalassovita litoralis]SMP00073.1 hypothetical protein SAMN06265173_1703 [Thalassovita litoralis]
MPDPITHYTPDSSSPAGDFFSVTPDDDTDLSIYCRALYIGTTGDLALISVGGTTVTFRNVAAGSILPVRASRVLDTGTTATDIVALW